MPGPVIPLFALTVGATELWPLLAVLDGIVLAWAAYAPRTPLGAVTIVLAGCALAFTLVPPVAYALHGPRVPLQALFAVDDRPVPPGGALTVLAIYGGAWQRGAPGKDAQMNARIASWGFRVIALQYPHAPAFRWPAQRDAILRQIDALKDKRIVLLGHSSGAQLALIAAALRPGRVAGVITYQSPVDLALGYDYPSHPDIINARAIMSALCGGTPAAVPECYRSASPRYAVHAGMPPVLMIAAGRDHVVDLGFEHLLRETLRADGVDVEYIELPWADHAFETVAAGFHNRIALWFVHKFLERIAQGAAGPPHGM
ncbi:MAG: alpha/beta hydrolase [Candidatus Baltobacteraceae bacterium]